MPKKVSESEKKGILESFINGLDLKSISNIYSYSPITISKQLKKILGNNEFEKIKNKNKNINKSETLLKKEKVKLNETNNLSNNNFEDSFYELVPISTSLENNDRKDLSSEPLENVNLPEVVYMLVDKKIELSPKKLRDYPEWRFLPESDLERNTLEIFADQKFAKKCCSNNQKLIKVPNSKIFLMASQSLKSKGISRIIFNELLLSIWLILIVVFYF